MPESADNGLFKARIEVALLFLLYLFILPRMYMDYDMGFWRQWALYLHHNGLSGVYSAGSPINYLPIYVYGLYVQLASGTDANIIQNINNIKILFVCFDFLPVIVLCCFRRKILSLKIPYLFLLINVAYVFNSMVWGQIDSIYTNLAFLAIITGILYPVAGTLLYLLALNTKQQAIEYLPIMLIVLLFSARKYQTVFKIVVAAMALQLILLLPFIGNGGVARILAILRNSVGLYHNLSICAFNIWYLIVRGNPYFINDTDTYLLISYRATGILLFAASAVFVLLPLSKCVWRLHKSGQAFDMRAYQLLFLTTGMLCLCFFYFNTQMHERYANPIIIFFFFYGVASRNYKLYILASIPYILSLDKCFSYPDGYLPIVHYKFIYASRIIAIWYTIVLGYGALLLYGLANEQKAVHGAR